MVAAVVHPTVSRVWTMHEEIRRAVEHIRSLIADLSEAEDEDGWTSPATGSGRVGLLVSELVARLRELGRLQDTDQDFSRSLASRTAYREEWSRVADNRACIQQSLHMLIELLGSMDRPDTTSWPEIERRFGQCERILTPCLTQEFDLVRRGLETRELAEAQ